MLRECQDCRERYDDAECLTYCPHTRFISPDDRDRNDLAFRLWLSRNPVRFAHQPGGPDRRIVSISHDGMVTIEGFSGEFFPHLFVEAA